MENKVLFLDPFCPHRSFKRGTEGLLGAAILGGTGLLSGGIGALSASSNNRAALAFNKWSQLQAQQYNTQMYERQLADQEALYNKYQSPQAIAEQLAKAGINPSALAAKSGFNGGTLPSVPSAGSASPLSAPALENSGAYIGQGIEQMSRVVSNLADSQLKQRQVTKVLAEIKGQEKANAAADFQNYLMQKYGENEKVAQLNDLISSALLKDAQKDYEGANTDLARALKMVQDKELNIKDEEYAQLVYRGTRLAQIYDDEHELRQEEKKVKKSQQSANYSTAEQARQSAKQIELQNKILGNPAYRQSVLSQTTLEAKNALDRHNISQEQFNLLKQQIELAKKENDIYKLREIMGIINETISSFGSAAGEVGRTIIAARFMRGMPAGSQIITSAPNQTILPNGQIVTNSFQQVHW